MWTILTFLLNALLFVLIGLQLPLILEGLEDEPMGELIGIAAAVAVVVIVSRIVWVHVITALIRTFDRRESQIARRGTWKGRMVVGWAACAARSRWPRRSRCRRTSPRATSCCSSPSA